MEAGEKLLQKVAARKDRLGDEAAFLYAFMAMDSGDAKLGASRFEEFLKNRPRSRKGDEAAWFAAYATFRTGSEGKEAARTKFARLVHDYPDSSLALQGLYWQARCSKPRDAASARRSAWRPRT